MRLVIVPRLYGNVRTAEIAPEGEHAVDIPNPSQEINSIGISLHTIVRFAGEIASWQFRRRLEFSDKMVRNNLAPLTRGRLSSGHLLWRAGGKAAPLLAP